MRRAKIVCTLGPATDSPERLRELIDVGMDVARFNLSHGSHAEHEERYLRVRKAATEAERNVGVLVDLQGPKIRLGEFADGSAELEVGQTFVITVEDVEGTAERASTTYKGLPGDVKAGDTVLIDDGRLALEVTDVTDTDVVTTVVIGGKVSNHKGLNLPGTAVSVPALSEKDIEDLRWGLRIGADMIALSFVRSASDVDDVHRIMAEEGVRLPVIAKVEKPQAVENLAEIVDAFDGVMVARGDLGVELPLWDVPLVQKRAVELCRRRAKPVIVATQMLDSMITNPRPTRAETSDVANAVLDGADAVMLSGETSVGAYPIETVATMAKIVEAVEDHGLERIPPLGTQPRTKGGAITKAAVETGALLGAKYLVAFTQSGDSARRMARLRPGIPLLAFSPLSATRHQLALSWGIEAFTAEHVDHTDEMVKQVDRMLLEQERCRRGDLVIIVAGSPPGIPGSTNAMRVHRIGDAVGKVAPAYH
ncbi:pyruvate kinase [Jiangella rhizosphaerae]|uniref:Pyruvate kinase n=1 Tax=Jiangella rhizosphaerae TaxID=2293569 RepID=A0A418KUS9_9ACTN|nr:pyruvate kinase [Jiangella rhizosphaerae]RIQ32500.1 pyruvate kinase [Jiangella rhizosphaerae]